MRLHILALATLGLMGCMCRPGVVDCTTNRAYPGFCKPLCGGPCDPFMWLAGDCSNCCCCSYKCGFTPYGGRTICGDEMVYGPSCVSPPLTWAPPAVPSAPSGHVVHLPPSPVPPAPRGEKPSEAATGEAPVPPAPPVPPSDDPRPTPPAEVESERFELPISEPEPERGDDDAPGVFRDTRHELPKRSRL